MFLFIKTKTFIRKRCRIDTFFYLHISTLLLFASLASSVSYAKSQEVTLEPVTTVYFAVADKYNRPLNEKKQSFACSDKIFTVVELSNYPLKDYQLSVRWYDPANKLRENTQYPFSISKEKTRLWAWLSLSRGAGAGMWQWINPAAGLEDFIGPWKVEVYINDKKIESKEFSVDC